MTLKDKLPVSYLLFTNRGRINRLTYWTVSIFIWCTFYILFNLLEYLINYSATWIIYPILFWALITTATKRLHDTNKSANWLWLILIPVFGPLFLIFIIGFKKGNKTINRFGRVPNSAPDYYINDKGQDTQPLTNKKIINEITQLHPIIVSEIKVPATVSDLQQIIINSDKPISIGGGRFSMGGQTASPDSIHVDMRKLNKIIDFSAENKTIKVEAGIRWCDIQQFIDSHDLSIKIMQTYANFTVGGALSVNCHGRYIGLGAVILSVKSMEIILANGELINCSSTENEKLFFASIGCYNAISVIATVEFDLAENLTVKRFSRTMSSIKYSNFFSKNIKQNKNIIFHNADLYPPTFKNARTVSWEKTNEKVTVKTRLMPLSNAYPIERYFIGAFSRSHFGKWRRENIIDPILYLSKKVHWRNYEAGYDVAELEPESRKKSTYVLQEYFIPPDNFDKFTDLMSEIFKRNKVNVINVSIRHAEKDPGSLLAWAKEEVFAYVIWYKQYTNDVEKNKVGVWTRELIDASLSLNGSYYLPYQVHATQEQFHKAYPNAKTLMKLKSELDPTYKFRNILWDTYFKQN
ncbi:MAG: FAD-binding protein [Bacteroidota bacterium]